MRHDDRYNDMELMAKIKRGLWEGLRPSEVAEALEVKITTVRNVKYGLTGYAVPWPDGSVGRMPKGRDALAKAAGGMRGVRKDEQELVRSYAFHEESRRLAEFDRELEEDSFLEEHGAKAWLEKYGEERWLERWPGSVPGEVED